jgi:hypothetical protein
MSVSTRITRLTPGVKVAHARMPGWEGTVTPNWAGRWMTSDDGSVVDVWVVWHAGTNGNGVLPVTGWYDVSYLRWNLL